MKLNDDSALGVLINRLKLLKSINGINILTSLDPSDDVIMEEAKKLNIRAFRGDLNNVWQRFFDFISTTKSSHFIRITALSFDMS